MIDPKETIDAVKAIERLPPSHWRREFNHDQLIELQAMFLTIAQGSITVSQKIGRALNRPERE